MESSDTVALVSMEGAKFIVQASALMASQLYSSMVDGEYM